MLSNKFRVTFPQTLNLNNFVKDFEGVSGNNSSSFMQPAQGVTTGNSNIVGSTSSEHGSVESAIKCDDCSTTDSESAIEEESFNGANGSNDGILNGNSVNNNNNNHNNNNIIGNGNTNNNNVIDIADEDEGIDMTTNTDHKNPNNETGQYIYELFAIMIHSGSASGGHYYAYIKEFETGEWFCFNDQSVTPVS